MCECASVSNDVPILVMTYSKYGRCFAIVTVRPGYSQLYRAIVGLGLLGVLSEAHPQLHCRELWV